MWKIPIAERDCGAGGADGSLADLLSLPVCYMGDWSEIGVVVPNLSDAMDLLRSNGYAVERRGPECPAEAVLESPSGVCRMLDVLQRHGIACEVGDVVDSIYRG